MRPANLDACNVVYTQSVSPFSKPQALNNTEKSPALFLRKKGLGWLQFFLSFLCLDFVSLMGLNKLNLNHKLAH